MKKLAAKHETALRRTTFDDTHPGPLLHDFALVLEYVGAGVQAGGKYNLPPLEAVPVLDPKLIRPLNLDLKRPQLRSHPYLQGLHLLLRASGLGRVEAKGKKARLVVDAETKRSWDRLNSAERYFTLMEAWLIAARPSMVGENDGFGGSLLGTLSLSLRIRAGVSLGSPDRLSLFVLREAYQIALMDLFGWMSMKTPIASRADFHSLQFTPLGEAMLNLLVLGTNAEEVEDDVDLAGETSAWPTFGRLQSLFQPYFPAWQNHLAVSSPATGGEGVYVWKFTVPGHTCWWRLALRHDHTLADLMYSMLRALDFDDDHLYEFRYRDALGREITAVDSRCEDGIAADEVTLGSLPLKVGETLKATFDFGDHWRFEAKLERIESVGRKKLPVVLESHGTAPEQYPSWD